MSTTVKLPDELAEMAKRRAAAENRSLAQQIEYWVRLGKAAEENPDIPLQLIKDILQAGNEAKAGLMAPHQFGV